MAVDLGQLEAHMTDLQIVKMPSNLNVRMYEALKGTLLLQQWSPTAERFIP